MTRNRRTKGFFGRIMSSATIESGHKSRTSNSQGLRRTQASSAPHIPARSCGEVAMITSAGCHSPAKNPVTAKLRKSRDRRTTAWFGAR